jgi:hypothetical protein
MLNYQIIKVILLIYYMTNLMLLGLLNYKKFMEVQPTYFENYRNSSF